MKRLLLLVPLLYLSEAYPMAQTPPSLSPDQTAVAEGNNAFAVDLYGQLRKQDGNLFFSPESISTAFAMAYAGARGTTAPQMATALHFTLPPDRLHPAMGALLTSLNAAHPGYQLHVADALWAEKDATFLDDFIKLTSTNYGAGFNRVDFKNAPDAVRQTINQWVEQKTENKIKDLIPPRAITPATRLVLTNAIYFKGDWLNAFDKGYTKDAPFTAEDGTSRTVPLMHEHRSFDYADSATFQALRAPYQKDQVSLILLLPHQGTSLASVIDGLDAASFESIIGSWTRQDVEFFLPRFKLHYQTSLNKPLDEMGMPLAFGPGANFTGMSPKVGAISNVIHKAVLEVDETGTVAAAATGIVMTKAMAIRNPRPPIVFRADHPFAVVIQDNATGTVLFAGAVYHPGG